MLYTCSLMFFFLFLFCVFDTNMLPSEAVPVCACFWLQVGSCGYGGCGCGLCDPGVTRNRIYASDLAACVGRSPFKDCVLYTMPKGAVPPMKRTEETLEALKDTAPETYSVCVSVLRAPLTSSGDVLKLAGVAEAVLKESAGVSNDEVRADLIAMVKSNLFSRFGTEQEEPVRAALPDKPKKADACGAMPKGMDSQPATHVGTDPQPAKPKGTDPQPATPEDVDPQPATPKGTDPQPATPQSSKPFI